MSKPVKIVFTLSLLLNLILLGYAGGCAWKRMSHPAPFAHADEQTQAAFKQAFEQNRAAMRTDMEAIRQSRGALETIMTAEEFDRAAYDAEVAKVLDVRDGMGQRRADILGGVLEELPSAERQKVVQKILAKLTEDRPGKRSYGHGPRADKPQADTPPAPQE